MFILTRYLTLILAATLASNLTPARRSDGLTFTERLDAAPTHLVYFARGAWTLVTQTIGEVIAETDTALTVRSAAVPNGQDRGEVLTIARADVVARRDNGGRFAREELHELIRTNPVTTT